MSITAGLEHVVRTDEPLGPHTRPWLTAVAEFFAEPTTEQELQELMQRFSSANLPIRLLGGGSNILVQQARLPGLVISLSAPQFCQIRVHDQRLTASGGTRLSHFVSTAVREGLAGPENLVGIPGTVGGAVHINTSVSGYDIGSSLASARVMTRIGEVVTRQSDSMAFSYRQSGLDDLVILEATFQFDRESPAVLTKRLQKLWIVRRACQPITESSIYVFKDHGFDSARSIIEQCGLKGTRIGDIEVSDRDPNLFITYPQAKCADAVKLIEVVRGRVLEHTGIELEMAVEVW